MKLPSGWRVLTLEEACSGSLQTGPFGSQLHADEYTDEGIPVVMPKDLIAGKIVTATAARIPEIRAAQLKRHRIQAGDVLFSRRGDVARAGLATKSDEGFLCGTGCLRARPDRNKVLPEFLNLLIQAPTAKRWLESNAVGQTMPNMNTEILSQLTFKIPSLGEQQKIADVLSAWGTGIEKTEQLIALRVRQKAWLLTQVISAFGHTTKLGAFLAQASHPVPKPIEPYWALGIRSHGKGTFHRFVENPSSVDMEELYALKRENLIVNITFAWEGAIALLKPEDEHCLVSHRFPTYEIDRDAADPRFVQYIVNCKEFFSQLALISPGGAGRNRVLNKKDFLKLTVSLPPLSEQKRLAHILGTLDQLIQIEANQLAAIKAQKRGLMQKLLTGQWRVPVESTAATT